MKYQILNRQSIVEAQTNYIQTTKINNKQIIVTLNVPLTIFYGHPILY